MMPKATKIQKLPRQAGLPFGVTTAYPILSRDFEAGMRIGISESAPGALDLDLTYDEAIYMLEGEMDIESEGETHPLKPGDFLWMPRGRQIVYRMKTTCKYLYAIPGDAPKS
jgi:ethanolamine utilization protein EutQ (cupin superfamily)